MGKPNIPRPRWPGRLSRRLFLQRAGWLGGAGLAATVLSGCGGGGSSGAAVGRVPVSDDPDTGGDAAQVFPHGVASGDPLQDRVMLWTHVLPAASNAGESIAVTWDLALDPDMRMPVAGGNTVARAERDFIVKVDVTGLQPGTTYYYRFTARTRQSVTGRTRTLPAGATDRLRMAVVSCASLPHGFFNAYGRIAQRADLDLVLHLGDYLYEYPGRGVSEAENPDEYGDGRAIGRAPEPPHEIITLDDYRTRHACYKLDPDLQALHRQHPMICVWDDHESTNDSYIDGAQNHNPERGEGDWPSRKARAIQAYYEWLPIRQTAGADEARIYRQFALGDLVDLFMLDTRLLAREQPGEPALGVPGLPAGAFTDSGDIARPRDLLGPTQTDWLDAGLTGSQARWKLLGQQVMFGQLKVLGAANALNLQNPGGQGGAFLNPDQWDGYPRAREQVWRIIRGGQPAPAVAVDNVVVLTGDIHTSWAMDLTEDPNNLVAYNPLTGAGALGVEFVTPSVTSPGLDELSGVGEPTLMTQNPHMKYINLSEHGYMLLDITPERIQTEWWFVDRLDAPDDGETLAAVAVTQSGSRHVVVGGQASAPAADPPALAP